MRPDRALSLLLCAAAPLAMAACATPSADELAEGDPLEGMNRGIHGFNEAVAEHVVMPMTDAVESRTSNGGGNTAGEVLHRVGNVLDNLGEPKNAVNSALQADPGALGTAVARFGLNSTVGLLGMYDVAGGIGLDEQKEDFGQTLGAWGAPSGPYMVAPIAGPSNARDVTGIVVDTLLNPVSLIPIPGEALTAASTGVAAAEAADNAEATVAASEADEDSYSAARNRYETVRDAQIANAPVPPMRTRAAVEHRGDKPVLVQATQTGAGQAGVVQTGGAPSGNAQPVLTPVGAAPGAEAPLELVPRREPLVIDIYPLDEAAQDEAQETAPVEPVSEPVSEAVRRPRRIAPDAALAE